MLPKTMVIASPSSKPTLTPALGGNSNSFSVIPAVATVVLLNVNPGNWIVTESRSDRVSKSITVAAAGDESERRAITTKIENQIRSGLCVIMVFSNQVVQIPKQQSPLGKECHRGSFGQARKAANTYGPRSLS